MNFENSQFFKLKHNKLEMPFGNFYFFKTFIISEISEGMHFDWEMIQEVMVHVVEFYGQEAKLGYISNRVNSYSINPQAWNKVQKKYNIIVVGAIVAYNKMNFLNASLEKNIANTSIKRCFSLEEAFEWVSNIRELNKE